MNHGILEAYFNLYVQERTQAVREEEESAGKKALWILACENGFGRWIEVFPLYATSEEDAELQAQILLVQETAKRPLVRFSLKPFPEGFIMGRRKMQGRT